MDFAEYARALARRWQSRHADAEPACLVTVRRPDSTHLLARRIIDEYTGEGTAPPDLDVVAWGQSGGLGRGDRRWSSPSGKGVYATAIRPFVTAAPDPDRGATGPPQAGRIQMLPLLIAVALCDALNRFLDGRCRLKWPNDLYVGRRKLGGILIDVVSPVVQRRPGGDGDSHDEAAAPPAPTQGAVAIVSAGVNFSPDLEAFEAPRSTSFGAEYDAAASGLEVRLDGLADELFAAIDDALAQDIPAAELVDRYRSCSLHRAGDTLRCRQGSEVVAGTFVGFSPLGFLRLEVDGEERLLSSGVIADSD